MTGSFQTIVTQGLSGTTTDRSRRPARPARSRARRTCPQSRLGDRDERSRRRPATVPTLGGRRGTPALLTDRYELTMLAGGAARRDRATAGACSRCSPAGCPTGAATASSPAPAGCSTRCPTFRFDDDRRCACPARRRRRRRRDLRLAAPTTGSPATSAATPRASSTSRARRSCTVEAHVRRGGRCSRRWCCRSSTTTARSPRPRPGWSSPRAAGRASRWARGAPTRRPPSPRRARPTSPASRPRPTWRPGAATASRPPAPRRTRSRCCTTTRPTRSARRSTALGPGTTLLVDTYDIAAGIRAAVEVAGPELGAVRIDSGDLGGARAPGARAARRARRDRHPHRAVRRPRRVRHRRAGRRARRRLRRRHLGRHRLGRPDGGLRLQARRGRRPAGGQAVRGQGHPRRAQDGGPPAPRRPGPPSEEIVRSGRRTVEPARRPGPAGRDGPRRRARCPGRPWTSPARTCARSSRRCRGRVSPCPAASPRSRRPTRSAMS